VDGVGDQFLAGAGLAADQDGGGPLRHQSRLLEHAAHDLGVADDVVEAVLPAHGAAQVVALLGQRTAFGFDVAIEPHALADEVGDHFQKMGVLVQQDFRAGCGLRRQHAGHLATDADGHADEGALGIVDAEPAEEARLVLNAIDYDGLAFLQDHAHHAFAGTVANLADVGFVEAVCHGHQQRAGLRLDQADHAALQADAFMQRTQHCAQGFLQVERARQHLADVIQHLEFGFQQLVFERVPSFRFRFHHGRSSGKQGSCTRMRGSLPDRTDRCRVCRHVVPRFPARSPDPCPSAAGRRPWW
jgi:hypothetical protein